MKRNSSVLFSCMMCCTNYGFAFFVNSANIYLHFPLDKEITTNTVVDKTFLLKQRKM